jgi:microcystin degradation protein MlrC
MFTGLGCDLASKRIIVVKSTQHFYAHFSKVAGEVIYAEAPGSVSMDFDQLPYRSIRLPRWPIGLQSGKAVAAEADSPLDGAHR